MDPRLTGVLEALGLKSGDTDVIRNAGTTVTEDVTRSVLVSTRVLGAREILIVNHTGTGLAKD
jgi:carbonic anhydrase